MVTNGDYRKFQDLLDEFLADPQFAADFLSDALQQDDIETLLASLRNVIRVHGLCSSFAEASW